MKTVAELIQVMETAKESSGGSLHDGTVVSLSFDFMRALLESMKDQEARIAKMEPHILHFFGIEP